jgi:hypothetical protein
MDCPKCGESFLGNWQALFTGADALGKSLRTATSQIPNNIAMPGDQELTITTDWMECPHAKCRTLIFRVMENVYDPDADDEGFDRESVVWPTGAGGRKVDALIPTEFAEPYREAASILADSPSMAAVLARGMLSDLLKAHGYPQERLTNQITEFMNDQSTPERLRRLVDPMRVLGDFGAHTLQDANGRRIRVSSADAEWTLSVLDRLFHHFIIEPANDNAALRRADAMAANAGRKPARRPKP